MGEKMYDLEKRTYVFAKDCRILVGNLPKTISNVEDGKQLVRSSGSVAANYIEANEKLGSKDFIFRLKIARKEAKESILWLTLLADLNTAFNVEIKELVEEAEQLKRILSSIINKVK